MLRGYSFCVIFFYNLYKNFHLPLPARGGNPAFKIFSKIFQIFSSSFLMVFKREEYFPIPYFKDILEIVAGLIYRDSEIYEAGRSFDKR